MNLATKLVLTIVCIFATTSNAQSDAHTPNDDPSLKQLDYASLKQIPIGLPLNITNLKLEDSLTVNLQLKRFELLSKDAKVVVVNADGQSETINPSVVLLSGTVIGDDDSMVFIGVSSNGTHGFVQHKNMLHFISTGPYRENFQSKLALQIANAASLSAPALVNEFCQTNNDNDLLLFSGKQIPVEAGVITGGPPCREVDVAVDTDWEFTGIVFAGDTTASAEYALFLMAATSEIFQRDLNTRLNVSFLRVWSENNDPYDANGSFSKALIQFRDHWIANHSDIDREIAHLLSGNAQQNGAVWALGQVCNYEAGYCISSGINGSFPYPLEDFNSDNWDILVAAHETEHIFVALHTEQYDPPLDNCTNGPCEKADQGTIMSSCRSCPGGLANYQLKFHPVTIDTILNYLESVPCDISSEHCCV